MTNQTERVRRIYDKAAGKYDRGMALTERLFLGDGRAWVCSRACGEVLEIAIGTGRNLPYYPRDVRLTGIELSPAMLEIARNRARELGVEVDLGLGDAQALPFPDGSFDTAVIALSLCTIPDDRKAVAEAFRVLRPGGRLLLFEHVRSTRASARIVQRLLDPLTVRLGGDHQLREPLDHLRDAGLEVERLERSKWGMVERLSAYRP